MGSTDKYRAKRHQVLTDLKVELHKGYIEDEIELSGHKFKLKTLSEEEELWTDTYTIGSTAMAIMSSMRLPKLAVAIVSIDDLPVSKLFDFPDDMEEKVKKGIVEDEVRMKYWLRDQMMMYLSEDTVRPFVSKLWEKFAEMDKRRADAMAAIPN